MRNSNKQICIRTVNYTRTRRSDEEKKRKQKLNETGRKIFVCVRAFDL